MTELHDETHAIAERVHALIQSKPLSPTIDELAAAIGAPMPEAVPQDGPFLDEDGNPVAFLYTNEEFAKTFLPTVRILFDLLARDRTDIAVKMKAFIDDGGWDDALDFMDSVQDGCNALNAISAMCTTGMYRFVQGFADVAELPPSRRLR